MVEPAVSGVNLRALTPTPTRGSFVVPRHGRKERISNSSPPSSAPAINQILPLPSGQLNHQLSKSNTPVDFPNPSMGDARDNQQNTSPMPDSYGVGSVRRRPRSRSHHHAQGSRFTPPTASTYSTSPGSNDNVHGTTFQGSVPHYGSTGVSYGHAGGYVAQAYAMPPQPTMTIGHTPPPFGGYPFHHPGVPEGSVIPHASYQPVLHAPVYYQRHSPEGASSSHPSLQNSRSPPQYPPRAPPPSSSAPPSTSSSAGLANVHSPSYVGTGPFQYQSPVSTPRFPYPSQSFPASPPMYHHPYPTHQGYAPELDQGAWYYLPHTLQQYGDGGPVAYQRQYVTSYPSMGHVDVEPPYPTPSAVGPQGSGAYNQADSGERSSADGSAIGDPHPPLVPSVQSPGPGPPSINATSASIGRQEKPIVRRAYHPNPPSHRSEWVMWVGNVPSDATHDELWRFFNQLPANVGNDASEPVGPKSGAEAATGVRTPPKQEQLQGSGVVSIFLISRSSCAFVNYWSEELLTSAIERFNGRQLRPHDPKCPKLVCRVRRKDDDLKAGVGGQRGQGLHTKWIKENKLKGRRERALSDSSALVPTSDDYALARASGGGASGPNDGLMMRMSKLRLSGDEDVRRNVLPSHGSSSGSFASTDSSLLAAYFPKRYFILKSLTQYDLDVSVREGLWATQKHNEGILDQAYRTSKEVYLIFGVNKSGEFYGYAKMAGPVQRGEGNVLWASRTREAVRPVQRARSGLDQSITTPLETPARATYLWPNEGKVVENSPLPMDTATGVTNVGMPSDNAEYDIPSDVRTPGPGPPINTAPAELGPPHRRLAVYTPATKSSTMIVQRHHEFELDPEAPLNAMRTGPAAAFATVNEEKRMDKGIDDDPEPRDDQANRDATWGDCFKVDWVCVERLPFHWTKQLRNPWNQDREVKVSRDGTELEPMVGQMLLDAWETMRSVQGQVPPNPPGSGRPPKSRRQTDGGRPGRENTERGASRS